MGDLQKSLSELEANDNLTVVGKYFDYIFTKDSDYNKDIDIDENNMVSIEIFDKEGRLVGATGDIHLNDVEFSEDTLEQEFIEGSDWTENLIDDDFDHKSYNEFLDDYER